MAIWLQNWQRWVLLWVVAGLCLIPLCEAGDQSKEQVDITRLPPDPRGGQAYRLTYDVSLPLDVFWRFKTDFDNQFLEENKYILKHRLIATDGNVVETENIYSNSPTERFRWKTTIFAEEYRLDFELIDSASHHHKFHYGRIQLQPMGNVTRVTQTAYFDFLGATFWALYPWGGGMKAFLKYTAKWERETALRLHHHYSEQPIKKKPVQRIPKKPDPE